MHSSIQVNMSMPRFAPALVRAHRTLSRPLENAAEACTLSGKLFQSPDIHCRSALEIFPKRSMEIKRNDSWHEFFARRVPKKSIQESLPLQSPKAGRNHEMSFSSHLHIFTFVCPLHICLFSLSFSFFVFSLRKRRHGERSSE